MLTEEQLEQRKAYVTGSDCAVICGASKWQTPYELWMLKTGRKVAPDISEKPAVKAGNMLEGAVAEWFEHETGKEVYRDDNFLVSKEHQFMAGNIDRRVRGESAILECKTAGHDHEWGESGTQRIPKAYLCQIAHYCAVVDVDVAYIAVLIRGVDFRWYTYKRDRELEDMIVAKEKHFYEEHMLKDVPPEPVTTKDMMMHLDSRVSDEPSCANADIDHAIERIRNIKENIKDLQRAEENIKNEVCIYMGESETLLGLSGAQVASWKLTNGSTRVDCKALKEKRPDIYKEFAVCAESTRRFTLKRKEK